MPLLKTELKNDILHLTLADSESRNAFSPAMASAFEESLSFSNYKGLLVTATGPLFCSGGNLSFYKALQTKEEGLEHNRQISNILNQLYELPVPTFAFVDGACYGGGVELISCFDWVLASPKSLFGLWQRRVGLTFGWGGQSRLNDRMGRKATMNWLSQGQTVSSYQALNWGLIDEIVSSEQGVSVALNKISQILQWGEQSLVEVKNNRLDQQTAFDALWMSDRHQQILKKFR